MRKSKKLISLLLATVMILSCFACLSSVSAFAAEGETQSATLIGDVDRNGRVDITDATIIQLYIANVQSALDKFESGEYDLAAADVNGSGVIDISDATAIQLLVANVQPTTAEPTTVEPTTVEPTEPVTAEPTTAEPTEPVTAEPTTAEPTEPVTAEPTTAEPTEPVTAEPTTAEPTEPVTAEPTTAEPTVVEPTTEPAPAEDVFVLAGTTNWLSTGWTPDPDAYTMEKAEDGTYSVTVPAVAAADGIYAVKVVQFIEGDAANAVWHGLDGTDLNVDFMLNEDCDVTVTFNPETGEITVTGDGVVPPVYKLDAIYAVGESGGTAFLNGESWKQDAESNKMTEVADGVYEITFEEVDTNTNYQFKFAANGTWDINWGYGAAGGTAEIDLNTPSEATYNGGNATFAVESLEDSCDVTLRLDLTNWDPAKKTGAMITVFVDDYEDAYPEIPGVGDLD